MFNDFSWLLKHIFVPQDFWVGWLRPKSSADATLYFSKFVSLAVLIITVCGALYGDFNFIELISYGVSVLIV